MKDGELNFIIVTFTYFPQIILILLITVLSVEKVLTLNYANELNS